MRDGKRKRRRGGGGERERERERQRQRQRQRQTDRQKHRQTDTQTDKQRQRETERERERERESHHHHHHHHHNCHHHHHRNTFDHRITRSRRLHTADYNRVQSSGVGFGPVPEGTFGQPGVLSSTPESILRSNSFAQVPVMRGFNSDEGAIGIQGTDSC